MTAPTNNPINPSAVDTTNASETLKEAAERIGDALGEGLLAQLTAWTRHVQLMDDAVFDAGGSVQNRATSRALDALSEAFLTTLPEHFLDDTPLGYEGAAYITGRMLFPGIVPDADARESDRLNGFLDNAFMVARVALMVEVAKAYKHPMACGVSYLMQSAAAVAERLLREGQEPQAEASATEEGARDNG